MSLSPPIDQDYDYGKWEKAKLDQMRFYDKRRREAFLLNINQNTTCSVTDQTAHLTKEECCIAKILIFDLFKELDHDGYYPTTRGSYTIRQMYGPKEFQMVCNLGNSTVLKWNNEISKESSKRICKVVQDEIERANSVPILAPLQPEHFTDAEMHQMMLESDLDGIHMIESDNNSIPIPPYRYCGIFQLYVHDVPGKPTFVCQGFRHPDGYSCRRFMFHGRVFEERSCRHAGYLTWTHDQWNQFHFANKETEVDCGVCGMSYDDADHSSCEDCYSHQPERNISNLPSIPSFGWFIGTKDFIAPWLQRWTCTKGQQAKNAFLDEMCGAVDLLNPNPESRSRISKTYSRALYKSALQQTRGLQSWVYNPEFIANILS